VEPGQSSNPYEAPKAALHVEAEAAGLPLASRWQRLGGSLLDGLMYTLTALPIFFGGSLLGIIQRNAEGNNPFRFWLAAGTTGTISLGVWLVLLAFQWTLIVKRGQTVGKIIAGTRIVKMDGSRVGFGHGVALRAILPEAIAFIPLVGFLFRLVDILFIFGAERRCVHDFIAGTKVVQVPGA
jgi:uncharacterized RDD family membrane protein YckC